MRHETAWVHHSAAVHESAVVDAHAVVCSAVVVERDVVVGVNATLCSGVHIEHGAVIGPGSVVECNVQADMIMAGNPARCVGTVQHKKSLRNDVKFAIPAGAKATPCRGPSCSALIFWIVTGDNRNMPVDSDGTPHWATCPDADKFKKKK